MLQISRIAVVVFASLCVSNAFAVKLYKWKDEQGNITYQDTPPPGSADKVEEKEFDTDANVVPAEDGQTAAEGAPGENRGAAAEDKSKDDAVGLEGEALSAAEEEARLRQEAEEALDDVPSDGGTDAGAVPEPGDLADPGTPAEAGTPAESGATGDAAATATPGTSAAGGATAGAAAGGTTGAGGAVAPPLAPAAPAVGP